MKTLDKTTVANSRKELDAALKTVAKLTGIDFKIGTIRFNDSTLRFKVEGVVRGAGSTSTVVPTNPELYALNTVGVQVLGVQTFDSNTTYRSRSLGQVKFVGYNARAHKFPFIVQQLNGKKYKITLTEATNMVHEFQT